MNELSHHGIKGMKWGVRRYQNEDGTLTDAGKKRYDRDVRENNAKKKENRIDVSEPDPKRWAKEDTARAKRLVDNGSDLVTKLKNYEKETSPKPEKKRLDLSKATDQELRQRINRELLERQYNDLFGETKQANVSKGREIVRDILEVTGSVLTIGSTALGLALAIKDLKG